MLVLLLAACTSKPIALEDDTAALDDTAADTDTDTDTDTDSDTDSDTDTDVNAHAGDHPGVLSLSAEDPREGGLRELCTADVVIVVAYDGTFSGEGLCTSTEVPDELPITLTGVLAADDSATGDAVQAFPGGDETYALTGAFGSDGLALSWSGTLLTPRGDEVAFEGAFLEN
jgi:hypothetical protein